MSNTQARSSREVDMVDSKPSKSSALRSFIHKRTGSKGAALSSTGVVQDIFNTPSGNGNSSSLPYLPLDHPHSRALTELPQNNQSSQPSSPKKSKDERRPATTGDDGKALHKKTLSTISLKSLSKDGGDKGSKSKDGKPESPKKAKTSSNLAGLLTRPKSSRNLRKQAAEDEERAPRDNKENKTPSGSTGSATETAYTPIFAQFSSQQQLGDKQLEDEIQLYTPQPYTPGRQRNFHDDSGARPTLSRREDSQRPKSTFLPNSLSVQDISRRVSSGRHSADEARPDIRPAMERQYTAPDAKKAATLSKHGKVKAAIATLNSKSKGAQPAKSEPVLEIKDVDAEFEAMLDRRNIPEHQRGKMRSLAMPVKIDFIKQDWAETIAAQSERPVSNSSSESVEGAITSGSASGPEPKVKRPRSRTFTLSRSKGNSDSASKKSKPEAPLGSHIRSKSTDSPINISKSLGISSGNVASSLIAKTKGQQPDEYVSYLRNVQKPELVEVGKLHKLRLLLRNETVAWTDSFIGLGGMQEIVDLLHRIMAVEWREEHEDTLLHESLLCLKALCTTALGLQHLSSIQTTLFPALVHMLFDEEKKGPSEFTTRNIITSVLFMYLKGAIPAERRERAEILLSYLRDPEAKEEDRPVPFVLEMRRERPFRVWCKEVVSVTKEVFWIFLHGVNVVILPKSSSASSSPDFTSPPVTSASSSEYAYMETNFPAELPPVPAAPYVGGVEWDATNYLASHLDLLNGILASLPDRNTRNELRLLLKVSGWERCMGATLRTCKEKFYGGVHAGLRCWVAAAHADGWEVADVRFGPPPATSSSSSGGGGNGSPKKKKKGEEPPRLEVPALGGHDNHGVDGKDWLG